MPAKAVCVIKGDVNGTIYFDQAVSYKLHINVRNSVLRT